MRLALAAAVVLAAVSRALAGSATEIEIKPGPSVMSDEEKSIAADVSKNIQHGVILMEETIQNDDYGAICEVAYRMRAKILSPEGRSLADVTIPTERGASDLKTWWGRTILPDGTVRELPENELKAQTQVKASSGSLSEIEMKGALPGVVPGAVIEYGYVVHVEGYYRSTRVFLQRSWPVRALRYRWVPDHGRAAAYALARSEGLPIDVKNDAHSVLVTAHDLNPVPEEPDMPPLDEARASATFYYTTNEKAAEYWELEGKREERALKSFFGGSWIMKEVLAGLQLPPDAGLEDRLRATYAWLGQNVKNSRLRSAEEVEADSDDDAKKNDAYSAKSVLEAKAGTTRQIAFLFAGVARALGAEANIVHAVDRTDRFWNRAVKAMDQFSFTFVAVRPKGAADDAWVFVAPGFGLPYGQVPWEATGTAAMMCSASGMTALTVPPASPKDNRTDTHVAVTFSDDNETMVAKWGGKSIGASGSGYRNWLRDLNVKQRKETLDRLCGSSADVEVTTAELPGLDDATAPFQLSCETERSSTNITDGLTGYTLRLTGPWWMATPQFTAAARVHPIVFNFPKVEVASMDVTAPHGFKPKAAPAEVKLVSPYGRYMLAVTQTPEGFHVDRAFALTVLIAKADEYAELRKFLDDVRNADQTAIAFERAPGSK